VFQPHRGTLVLGAGGIPHRVDVYTQGITEAALHLVRRQVDEECRQLAVSSSVIQCSAWFPLLDVPVACGSPAGRGYNQQPNRWYGTG
jgi:hypothetical protein